MWGLVTAFAPTILIPGIKPRSTRWKADEKVEAFFRVLSPLDSCNPGCSPSLRQNGEDTRKRTPTPGSWEKRRYPCETTFPGPLGFSGCSPQIREQFAYLVCRLAFLIGLGLHVIHLEQSSFGVWAGPSLRKAGMVCSGDGLESGTRPGRKHCTSPKGKCESRTALLAEASRTSALKKVWPRASPASPLPIPASIPSRRKLCGSCRKSF